MLYYYLILIFLLINFTHSVLAVAQNQPEWAVRCESENEKRCYLVQNVFLKESQQRLAGLALSQQNKDTIALVSVPLGVNLAAGAEIQIDKTSPLNVAYQMCNPQGCHGGLALSRSTLNALLRAKKLVIFYQEPLGRKIGIPFSIKDFKSSWETFKANPPSHVADGAF